MPVKIALTDENSDIVISAGTSLIGNSEKLIDHSNEVATTVDLANAIGEDGDQGIQGIAGEDGEQGDKGETGDTGDQGETGDKGEQGLQGFKGSKGETGDKGVRGEQGDDGPQGDIGDPSPPARWHNLWRLVWDNGIGLGGTLTYPDKEFIHGYYQSDGVTAVNNGEILLVANTSMNGNDSVSPQTFPGYVFVPDGLTNPGYTQILSGMSNVYAYNGRSMNSFNIKTQDGTANNYQCHLHYLTNSTAKYEEGTNSMFVGIFCRPGTYYGTFPE